MDVRKIIHIDQDAFFASCEQRDNPALRGRPIAVGSPAARGVVAAASYEAREFGIRSAMPSVTAARKCPDLVFVPPRFEVYRAVSAQIREIFLSHTDLVEPLSLDEAYLDVTTNRQSIPYATDLARQIRAEILERTGLTASAGISYNKFLAKMASGQNKPNGQYVITPGSGAAFVAQLPIEKFHGIGPATAARMHALGVKTGADLALIPRSTLESHFRKSGRYFWDLARGIDLRPVEPHRERKSLGAEDTFSEDVSSMDAVWKGLEPLIEKVWSQLEKRQLRGRTATLKLKYCDFSQITRAHSMAQPIGSPTELSSVTRFLLEREFPLPMPIRLVGISVSRFDTGLEVAEPQLELEL
jgi:DNA polymerase-4